MGNIAPGFAPGVGAEPVVWPVGEAPAPGARSVADVVLHPDVDPLTGLASADRLYTAVRSAWLDQTRRAALVVVVVGLPPPASRFEDARRLAVAGDMGRAVFARALAVGRLGARRVGVLAARDPALAARTDLLARMVRDLPARVHVVPVPGTPVLAASLLEDLSS